MASKGQVFRKSVITYIFYAVNLFWCISGQKSGHLFIRSVDIPDSNPPSHQLLLETFHQASQLSCAFKCKNREACTTINYDTSSQICHLLGGSPRDVTVASTIKSFKKTNLQCHRMGTESKKDLECCERQNIGKMCERSKSELFTIEFLRETTLNLPILKNVDFPETNNMSICFWFKVSKKWNHYDAVFSYVTKEISADNDLLVWIKSTGIFLTIRRSSRVRIFSQYSLNIWTHLCVLWESTGKWSTYINGTIKKSGVGTGNFKGTFQKASGFLLLGQDTDVVNSKDTINQASQMYIGKITELYIYHSKLTRGNIVSLFKHSPVQQNVVVDWQQFKGKASGGRIVEFTSSF